MSSKDILHQSSERIALVRRLPEEKDGRFCKKRKDKYLVTPNDNEFKQLYSEQLEHQVPLVRIFYGPYEVHGIIRHREQKLYGTVECLRSKGYAVELIQTLDFEEVVIEMFGKEVYRVNIRYLMFNQESVDDLVSYQIVKRVEDAIKRLNSVKNVPRKYILSFENSTNVKDSSKPSFYTTHESDASYWP